jgi:hypothetical protein
MREYDDGSQRHLPEVHHVWEYDGVFVEMSKTWQALEGLLCFGL